jgi:hypothetical protein
LLGEKMGARRNNCRSFIGAAKKLAATPEGIETWRAIFQKP